MPTIDKILIANRGEIACRIMQTCRKMGIATVAVYSEADADAAHVAMADDAVCIGAAPARESYLRAARIIEAAQATGAKAIHPGYGFLAESADFARAVEEAGLIWIGPAAKIISGMGDKGRARAIAQRAGVPVMPGSPGYVPGETEGLIQSARQIGFPLLVKAAAGGGGIGMKRVDREADLLKAVETTQSMAERSFGDGTVFLERFVNRGRHVEVQVFGFGGGAAVHLGDRDCSVQRRYQKVIEEAPAPALPTAVQEAMRQAATQLAASVGYESAGTVEFIYDVDRESFHFLEMNTRIQVEHPVTEMVTGIDIVGWQIEQAGRRLKPVDQGEIRLDGHSIEARIYAERPEKNFLPSPGTIDALVWPDPAEHLRIESAIRAGDSITPYYDPMICKVVVHGATRREALARLDAALAGVRIEGVQTNRDFVREVLASDRFASAQMTIDLIATLQAKETA